MQFGNANLYLIAYGVLFILILRLLPGGIVPGVTKAWRGRLVARARARQGTPPAGGSLAWQALAWEARGREALVREALVRTTHGQAPGEGQSMSVIEVTDLNKS